MQRSGDEWRALIVGNEGKSRPAEFTIPKDLPEDEILDYLDVLFHEYATVERPKVRRI